MFAITAVNLLCEIIQVYIPCIILVSTKKLYLCVLSPAMHQQQGTEFHCYLASLPSIYQLESILMSYL